MCRFLDCTKVNKSLTARSLSVTSAYNFHNNFFRSSWYRITKSTIFSMKLILVRTNIFGQRRDIYHSQFTNIKSIDQGRLNKRVFDRICEYKREETEKLKITDKNCLDREQYGKKIV